MSLAHAVSNNAVWCDAVCRAHGLAAEFLDSIWLTREVTPPFYPNAVTLTSARDMDVQLHAIRTLLDAEIPGAWAVKDSYRLLDLAPFGFRPLFDATWIGCDTAQSATEDARDVRWHVVRDPAALEMWEIAWRGEPANAEAQPSASIFLPALLDNETIAFFAASHNNQIVAGAIGNRTGEVVGISNVFLPVQNEMRWRAGCVTAVAQRFPGLPMVGYESGNDLAAFRKLGFTELGSLRIWTRVVE